MYTKKELYIRVHNCSDCTNINSFSSLFSYSRQRLPYPPELPPYMLQILNPGFAMGSHAQTLMSSFATTSTVHYKAIPQNPNATQFYYILYPSVYTVVGLFFCRFMIILYIALIFQQGIWPHMPHDFVDSSSHVSLIPVYSSPLTYYIYYFRSYLRPLVHVPILKLLNPIV